MKKKLLMFSMILLVAFALVIPKTNAMTNSNATLENMVPLYNYYIVQYNLNDAGSKGNPWNYGYTFIPYNIYNNVKNGSSSYYYWYSSETGGWLNAGSDIPTAKRVSAFQSLVDNNENIRFRYYLGSSSYPYYVYELVFFNLSITNRKDNFVVTSDDSLYKYEITYQVDSDSDIESVVVIDNSDLSNEIIEIRPFGTASGNYYKFIMRFTFYRDSGYNGLIVDTPMSEVPSQGGSIIVEEVTEVITPDFGTFIIQSISGFLDAEIWGGVSIGTIFGFIIMIPILIWLLKMFFGG